MFCEGLVSEKFMVFNKQYTKEQFFNISQEVCRKIGKLIYKHPAKLTKKDVERMRKSVNGFDPKIIKKIIRISELPDYPTKNERRGKK